MDQRRVLLVVILSFIILYGFQALFPPPVPPDQAPPAAASKTATAPRAAAPEAANPVPSVQPPTPAESGAPVVPEREVVVENAEVRGVFTSQGAVLKSWQLKKYRDAQGRPFDILAGHAPAGAVRPFTLAIDDATVSAMLELAPFNVTESTGPDGSRRVVFDYADLAGLKVQKTFSVAPSSPYVIDVAVSASQNGQALPVVLRWGPALGSGITVASMMQAYNPPAQPIFFKDGKVTRVSRDKIPQQAVQEGAIGFGGVDDHYFLTSVVKPAGIARLQYAPVDVTLPDRPEGAHYVDWSARYVSPVTVKYFAGPKDFDVLAAVDRDLVRAIDFGMFAWLVVPLLRALKWINGYAGNYGWSIVLLTVFINLAIFPLRHKSVVSMRRMQDIQPEMKAIQDRYKHLKMTDPARGKMNQEMMELYKTRGVNPASGCVPVLLTIPVLFAFYAMLSVAIELRGAPFVGWIHDLSASDPYYVLPVLMGVTMFIQQKMTPIGSMDPVQQKMMLFMMPIMMTVFMVSAASGLLLYWTVSNIWGIAQTMLTNKLIGPAPVRPRPPAERQMKGVKSVGGGKTEQAKERNS